MCCKYENGKIYKIVSKQTSDVYIGSTITSVSCRFSTHKSDYKRYLSWLNGDYDGNTDNLKNLNAFEIMFYDDVEIIEIEKYPCSSVSELREREGWWQLNTENCINKLIAGRGNEYHNENRKGKKRKCGFCNKLFDYSNRSQHERRCKLNPEREPPRDFTEYISRNKDKINKRAKEWRKTRFNCPCGWVGNTGCKSKHIKTSKLHLKWLNSELNQSDVDL